MAKSLKKACINFPVAMYQTFYLQRFQNTASLKEPQSGEIFVEPKLFRKEGAEHRNIK